MVKGGGVGCRRGVRKDRVSVAPGPEAVTLTDIQRQCCGSVPGSQGETRRGVRWFCSLRFTCRRGGRESV